MPSTIVSTAGHPGLSAVQREATRRVARFMMPSMMMMMRMMRRQPSS